MERAQEDTSTSSINYAIRSPITSIQQGGGGDYVGNKHRLYVDNSVSRARVNRESVEFLVNFLRGDDHEVTHLDLGLFTLSEPSDGGLNALRDFFANDATLTKVELWCCDFGNTEEAVRLLAAFEENTSVTNLTIGRIQNLDGVTLATCLSRILQNSSNLQRLGVYVWLDAEAVRLLQPGLQYNRMLKELCMSCCQMDDECLSLLVDVVGRASLEELDISNNRFTSRGLDHISRLLESSQLTKIKFGLNERALMDDAANQRFAHVISRNKLLKALSIICTRFHPSSSLAERIFQALESNSTLEDLQFGQLAYSDRCCDQFIASLPKMKGLRKLDLHEGNLLSCLQRASFLPAIHKNESLEEVDGLEVGRPNLVAHHLEAVAIRNVLSRNRNVRRAAALLALQRPSRRQIPSKSGVWYKAFGKMTSGPDKGTTLGASAIYKILQARPTILERPLRQPGRSTRTAASTRAQHGSAHRREQEAPDTGGGDGNGSLEAATRLEKRPRLS